MRVFLFLDKKTGLNKGTNDIISRDCKNRSGTWEGDYFFIKRYENGNYHCIFKDTSILKDINEIAISDREQGINLIKQKLFN